MTAFPDAAARRVDGAVPLEDYAAIGDGRTVALIALDGRIDWLALPSLTTQPVFAALVDAERGGRVELAPVEPFTASREYVAGTNVLVTRFRTASGAVEVTDALVTGVAGRLPWAELARRVVGVEGHVEMTWAVVPGGVFDGDRVHRVDSGFGPLLRVGTVNLVLAGSGHGRTDPVEPGAHEVAGPLEFRGRFVTEPGSRHLIIVCGTDDEPIHLVDPDIVDEGIDRTIAAWQRWSDEFTWDGPWAETVRRSALALKLLIFSPTGAIAAAATSSLPESRAGGKNWDYRYAWVRDLAYTVDALIRFGLREEPHAAVSWVLSTLKAQRAGRRRNRMHVFFQLDGALPDAVRRVDAAGWRGIGPVVRGNPAGEQLQLGVYADLISIVRAYAEGGNVLDETTSTLMRVLADEAARMWRKKDSGMWELPEQRHYTTSKIGCWAALDSALRLVELQIISPPARVQRHWRRERDRIRRWVDRHGWSERRGAYVMAKGSDALDASILLHAVSGFDRGERMSRTIDALRAELGRGPHLYRYSGMPDAEGAFVACSFWTASALACVGRIDEATALMDELVGAVNDVGLLAEMVDPASGEFLGNLPQALSHLALINAASVIHELSHPLVEEGP